MNRKLVIFLAVVAGIAIVYISAAAIRKTWNIWR